MRDSRISPRKKIDALHRACYSGSLLIAGQRKNVPVSTFWYLAELCGKERDGVPMERCE
jgi:hypothetical protein